VLAFWRREQIITLPGNRTLVVQPAASLRLSTPSAYPSGDA